MSLYTQWLNKIKSRADESWLTDSQKAVYTSIVSRWVELPFVCICGPSGSGKSFIARLLAAEHRYIYANALREAPESASQVIVDGEEYSRLMRPAARLKHIGRVIIVGRRAPQDPMPKILLSLTERDVRQFMHNLIRAEIIRSFITEPTGVDLGEILRREAIARGC